ncbi:MULTISPECIES: 5-deoxy-glucuronate isomerase [unclassified Devosia]|uniref:5-deoxy-glucuronate isomerase n=1 Tax=unclassified Devosia TaxID=196773 RepID=UPI0008689B06|nr:MULTISPECIES: 5-deoxy-glucuronate isomerase [unclassified Devosia]MBN9362010.1 5-deoxy-glucuronate isomerase [Devosia sp.]ODS82527.1 MAG: 5-deoxy-glucuronate isomerase [Devosia sp. SCN 66-27]OJX24713.1 MAG: 5-deoxy-glucuronate isomerase [Devosia sp. 66-14]
MPNLKARPAAEQGHVHHITPQSAGWTYVGFDLHKLPNAGDVAHGGGGDREVCIVLISGRAKVSIDDQDFLVGGRMSPFEGPGYSVYAPAGANWRIEALTPLEVAVCSAPGVRGARPPRVIGPDDVEKLTRGTGTNTRYPTNILPETAPADSLLVVEVITPGGHTSSYPPHRHDEDDLPRQSFLEETYYHRFSKPQGFGFQRVYTDDRSLDETMLIEDGDVVMVPRGYHPVAAVAGYDIYYLNVMAGPKRTWKFYNAPEHEWMIG